MRKQKPHALCQTWMLFEQAFNQADKRTGTAVRCQNRWTVFAAQWVIGIILKTLSKKSSVHIEKCWLKISRVQSVRREKFVMGETWRYALISLMAKATYRCIVSSTDGCSTSDPILELPNPGI